MISGGPPIGPREMGVGPDEAHARVKEAERLIAAGHRAEAEPFLSRALEL